jgi:hypothetical protein
MGHSFLDVIERSLSPSILRRKNRPTVRMTEQPIPPGKGRGYLLVMVDPATQAVSVSGSRPRPSHLPTCAQTTASEKRCRSPERPPWAQSGRSSNMSFISHLHLNHSWNLIAWPEPPHSFRDIERLLNTDRVDRLGLLASDNLGAGNFGCRSQSYPDEPMASDDRGLSRGRQGALPHAISCKFRLLS